MIFEKKMMPDLVFSSYRDVTPDVLSSLAPYEELDASDGVVSWYRALREAGVSVTLVSNNHRERAERFCARLGCPFHYDVKKPSVKYLLLSMEEMGSGKRDAVFLGDQLLTDALAAHRAGIRALIVPPIKDKKTLFFKAKRLIEKPYMKKYRKLHGGCDNDKT